jgi:hypothetical protein
MKPKCSDSLVGTVILLMISLPAFAHHGYAAYDMTKTETVKATIVEILLQNPHSTVSFDVKTADGEVQHWYSESANPRAMRQEGYTPENIKPGDQVTIYYHPSKNGSHVVVLAKVELPDGRVLPLKRPGAEDDQQ